MRAQMLPQAVEVTPGRAIGWPDPLVDPGSWCIVSGSTDPESRSTSAAGPAMQRWREQTSLIPMSNLAWRSTCREPTGPRPHSSSGTTSPTARRTAFTTSTMIQFGTDSPSGSLPARKSRSTVASSSQNTMLSRSRPPTPAASATRTGLGRPQEKIGRPLFGCSMRDWLARHQPGPARDRDGGAGRVSHLLTSTTLLTQSWPRCEPPSML